MMVSLPFQFDPTGEAQRFAGKANLAVLRGDTGQARAFHDKAAQVLEADVANRRKRSEKDALRFLAATQYYHGGLYVQAELLCRKIQADLLSDGLRALYPKFLKAVRERAKPDYAQKIREQLARHLQNRKYQQALDLLKEHQYIIEDEGKLALVRGYCCEQKGDYQGAAIFAGDAIQKSPNDAELVLMSTAAPLSLSADNKLDDAWQYAQQLLKYLPHALTYLAASCIRFKQAALVDSLAEKRSLHSDQIRLFTEAEHRFFQLPQSQQQQVDFRELMILDFAEAVIAHLNLESAREAQTVLDKAICFASRDPFLLTLQKDLRELHPELETASRTILERENKVADKLAQQKSDFRQLAA